MTAAWIEPKASDDLQRRLSWLSFLAIEQNSEKLVLSVIGSPL